MRGLAAALAVIAFGCSGREAYHCADSSQCVGGGTGGVCETTGFCSFADDSCPGGHKYEPRAGDGLAGTCVEPASPMPDAPVVCGGPGEPCCTEGSACGTGASCREGTCQSCVADVTFGHHFGCVLRVDHTVWCVGDNTHGQIGIGLAATTPVTSWMQSLDLSTTRPIDDATALVAGHDVTCALRAGGTVSCWGANNYGQLGRNTTTESAAAAPVLEDATNLPLANLVELAAGDEFVCGRNAGGEVWCWGRNDGSQLGDGTVTQRPRAVPVLEAAAGPPIKGAVALTAAADSACLRKSDGATYCWGKNDQGQLGDGTIVVKKTPALVGMTRDIDAGSYAMTCRVLPDGTAACAGSTWRNRLGDGRSNQPNEGGNRAPTPVAVLTERDGAPLADVTQIVVGGAPCARLGDGTVECWGDNTHGQTGTGTTTPFPAPVRLADGAPLDHVAGLRGQYAHLCAVRDSGEVLCWGRNRSSELGDGTTFDVAAATPLSFTCP